MWAKRWEGIGIGIGGAEGWTVTLALEQLWQSLHQAETSAASLGHTQRALTKRLVPLIPG